MINSKLILFIITSLLSIAYEVYRMCNGKKNSHKFIFGFLYISMITTAILAYLMQLKII